MKRVLLVCLVVLLGPSLMLVRSIPLIGSWASVGATISKQIVPEGTGTSGRISLHAAGRGNPWINLRDGVDLPTAYTGATVHAQALEQDLGQPLALASGDFDEDGVPDLLSGYAGSSGGRLVLHRGNVDAIYPNSPEAQPRKATGEFTNSPFLLPVRAFEVPEAPEFLGTGDFDNDGHWDIVAAARESKTLYLLPSDGRGGFGSAKQIELPGTITAPVTGEINRADGLADVVVGIVGPEGPRVLVFEGPEGALRNKPEVLTLPAEATALALGQLDEDYPMDLAVAAGNELLIVHGRDRRLSLDETRRVEVPPAAVDHRTLPFAITSLAAGDFVWDQDHRMDLALLLEDGTVQVLEGRARESGMNEQALIGNSKMVAAGLPQMAPGPHLVCVRVSVGPTDDLVVMDRITHQLHILMGDTMTQQMGEAASVPMSSRPSTPVSLDVEGGGRWRCCRCVSTGMP